MENGTDDMTQETMEGLAIVGFSFKFPGGAEDADSFWEMLIEGRNVMTQVPKDRINIDGFHHPNTSRKNSVMTTAPSP